MKTTIVIIALVGTMAGLLIPVSGKLAKYFWPGWRTGQWLSSIPFVCVVLVFGLRLSRK